MYSQNDWRNYSDELYHHQRKGAKWGVRHGPPYPLDRDQLSAEQKKLGGVSKSAREKYGNAKSSSTSNASKSSGTKDRTQLISDVEKLVSQPGGRNELTKKFSSVCDEIKSDPKLSESIKEMQKIGKDYENYLNGKQYSRYATLAGIVNYNLVYKNDFDVTKDDAVIGYRDEDFDQGEGNSYSLYLMDKGYDLNKYDERCSKALKDYNDSLLEAVNNYFGDQADSKVYDAAAQKDMKITGLFSRGITNDLDSKDWFGPPLDDVGYSDPETERKYRDALKKSQIGLRA